MTNEEAACLLDPETNYSALVQYEAGPERMDAVEEALRIAAAVLREPKMVPLTLEQLRGMGGRPVWIVEHPDWGHWELSEDGEDYIADRDPELYGLRHDDPEGKFGLHKLGWLAYAYPPAIGSNQRKIGVEPLTTMDYKATVRAVKALKVERGSLSCLGCGYEDNCTLHGCAILRNAADHMEAALANHDHLTALLDQTEAALNAATARAEQAERERDAAIADLKEIGDCEYCSGKCSNLETEDCRDCSDIGCQCRTCAGCSNWAWRGRPC